jgi:hypothetical protein
MAVSITNPSINCLILLLYASHLPIANKTWGKPVEFLFTANSIWLLFHHIKIMHFCVSLRLLSKDEKLNPLNLFFLSTIGEPELIEENKQYLLTQYTTGENLINADKKQLA